MRNRLLVTCAATLAALTTAVLVAADVAHWRSSLRGLGSHASATGTREAVVVLGFRNRGTRANFLNRYRVRAGVRSRTPSATESVLVLCGGAVAGNAVEADLMARYARDELGYAGSLLLERESRSTWENISNAIPLIEDADVIKVVSNSMHAEKGRRYLRTLRPDLADRLQRGNEHRFGELLLVKPVAVILEWRSLRRVNSELTRAGAAASTD